MTNQISDGHREVADRARAEREVVITKLRTEVKKRKVTYATIGGAVGKSASWVGEVMRGNYPYYDSCQLPENIADALSQRGFDVPDVLRLFPRSTRTQADCSTADWKRAMETYDRSTAVQYGPRVALGLHQIVVHPSFGVGFVSEILGNSKVELTFRNVSRIAVHGRGITDEELRGSRVDEGQLRKMLALEDAS